MKIGLYIHIPFCESRCVYCGFYSTTLNSLHKSYLDALFREMEMRHNEISIFETNDGVPYTIDTIYIGGGTPSVLSEKELVGIIEKSRSIFPGVPREITVEMNPDDVTVNKISAIRSAGVNRISIGIQTFDDDRLRFLRRRHTVQQARNAFKIIRDNGIENISIDLMFGFPGETLDEWKIDLNEAIALSPEHISAYCLMYEEGTPLYNMLENGTVKQIDEEISLSMYNILIDTLAENGYEHYEISNFARYGKRSIHNSSYWHDIPYLGFGASAHSYTLKKRSWNVDNIKEYISMIRNGILPSEEERIDNNTHYNDLITTAMRTCEGLNLDALPDYYSRYAMNCASESIRRGLLEVHNNHLRLTREGLFVSDRIMGDLMKV